ncbi:hypothetical protein Baya_5850 [Bagarius yarrelli]|uniref:Uncharacterized protein n=1 Tax=Bagarius yarrelli TaxID=175774 RepID=A0A556TXQ9_BAGYA|nr:hypothetical protein Baya_5850 [Bagarius yarrelli]
MKTGLKGGLAVTKEKSRVEEDVGGNGRDVRGLTVCHLLSGSAGGKEMTEESRSNVNGGALQSPSTVPMQCYGLLPEPLQKKQNLTIQP